MLDKIYKYCHGNYDFVSQIKPHCIPHCDNWDTQLFTSRKKSFNCQKNPAKPNFIQNHTYWMDTSEF